jgi:hypothetical protein
MFLMFLIFLMLLMLMLLMLLMLLLMFMMSMMFYEVVPFVSSPEEAEEYTGGYVKRFLRFSLAAKKSFRAPPCQACHMYFPCTGRTINERATCILLRIHPFSPF